MDTHSSNFQLEVALALAGFLTAFISCLAYLSYTPEVNKMSPEFTSDTVPFIGSWRFFTHKWAFWKKAVAMSKTGHFSFWLGKYHVVGVSGEAARKLFLDNHDFGFVEGAELVGHGPDFVPPMHKIFHPDFHHGRSYFQRRLIELQKAEQLAKHLQQVTKDARGAFEAMAKDPSGILNPSNACYRIVVTQGCRVVFGNEISDDPKLLARCLSYLTLLMHTTSIKSVAVPWLPSLAKIKRRYGRYGLSSIITPIVEKRMQKCAPRADDALQLFIDKGDSKDFMVSFFISILFIANANAGVLAGAMLNIVAHHSEWQSKILGEVKAVAMAYSTDKDAPLVDQLDSIPLEAWETSLPSLDLCYKEAIRMWVAFPMIRLNMSPHAVSIPGTDEVIPAGTFAAYNTTDVHYNEELYPDPTKYDPTRFREGREEFKRQAYGFVGWGQGRHPCLGMRWARLQQSIIIAYALAMYKWSGCDANGQPSPHFSLNTDLNSHAPSLPQGLYCKLVPREKA